MRTTLTFLSMFLAVVLLFIACAGILRADIIFLEDGRVIEGEIIEETADETVIKTSAGATMRLESWQVLKVLDMEEILKQYEEKKKDTDMENAGKVYDLATWCRKHGLKERYEHHLREVLKLDVAHAEAKKELNIIEGKIELPPKPKQLTEEEKEALKKKAEERRKAREAAKEKKEEKSKFYPFGTVTPTQIIPGDLDCKGDCRNLKQGGYMKFDLSGYEAGKTIGSAQLKVYVKNLLKNPWLWVCQVTQDPAKAAPKDLHAEIQKHALLISGAQKVKPDGWATIRLSRRAVDAINKALADKHKRWFALALTFE